MINSDQTHTAIYNESAILASDYLLSFERDGHSPTPTVTERAG
jgi:hypothetical protein